MATLTIRQLDDNVRDLLRERAIRNRRSVEAEVREILTTAVQPARDRRTLKDLSDEFRTATGGIELPIPPRVDQPEVLDLAGPA